MRRYKSASMCFTTSRKQKVHVEYIKKNTKSEIGNIDRNMFSVKILNSLYLAVVHLLKSHVIQKVLGL